MLSLYQWLWHLGPANPMVVRIVQGGSRRQRHLWVRMGYLGALIALVLFGLLSAGGLGPRVNLTELAKAGSAVFTVVAFGQVVLVCLLAPLFMAGAIAAEQQGKTLNILLTTPLSNLQIVLGSLLGRLFFILALLVSGLPLFAVLLIFGGVPINAVFISFAVAGLTALVVGAVAVNISVMRTGGRKAVFIFVIVIATYLIAAYALDHGILRHHTPTANTTTLLTPLHPLLVLEATLTSATYRPPSPEQLAERHWLARLYLGKPFAAFSSLSLILSFTLVLFSALLLRRIGQGEHNWLKPVRKLLRLPVEQAGERRRKPRDVWANPVAWREAHTRGRIATGILARWTFAALALGLAILLLGFYHFDLLPIIPDAAGQPLPRHQIFHSVLLALLLIQVAVVTMVALYMSASSVSREREDGTLDLVLTTPITPKQYIWGKLRGLVSFLSLLIALPVLTLALVSAYAIVGRMLGLDQATYVHTSITTYAGSRVNEPLLLLPETAILMLLMIVPFVALCVMTGMTWSLKARGVLGAVIPSVAIIGLLAIVFGLCGANAARNIPLLGPVINAFSPATNLAMLINPWDRVAAFPESPAVGRVSLIIAAAVAATGYSMIVYAMLLAIVRGFDQTVRRLSGVG